MKVQVIHMHSRKVHEDIFRVKPPTQNQQLSHHLLKSIILSTMLFKPPRETSCCHVWMIDARSFNFHPHPTPLPGMKLLTTSRRNEGRVPVLQTSDKMIMTRTNQNKISSGDIPNKLPPSVHFCREKMGMNFDTQ